MKNNDDDNYERQSKLLEKFLSKNDKTAFMKMLNMNINSNPDKENNHKKRAEFLKSMKNRHPAHYYDYFNMKPQSYNNNISNNNDLYNYNNNYNDNQINNFKLDFHNIYQDPEYKDKCMKGNYKWGNMKFQLMKINMAKRKGVSIENLHMPKVADRRKNHMGINGQFVMENNPLAHNINNGKKNIAIGIRNSLRIKMGKVNQENLIKRQMTQKLKPNNIINENEINKLDINF